MFRNREKSRKHALLKNDENKIKRKRERLQKQIKFHSNVEYKFVSKNDFKENADQTI